MSAVALKYGLSLTATGIDAGVAGEVIDVQLDRRRAGVLYPAGVARPAAGRRCVQAADHGNVDRGRRALDKPQIPVTAMTVVDGGRKIAERLGVAFAALKRHPLVVRGFAAHLFLEQ
jgi:hypothetical protein